MADGSGSWPWITEQLRELLDEVETLRAERAPRETLADPRPETPPPAADRATPQETVRRGHDDTGWAWRVETPMGGAWVRVSVTLTGNGTTFREQLEVPRSVWREVAAIAARVAP